MAAQRPKRNNSPINLKHQPLKATVPLSSLVRNTSPTRRRTSPSSPGLPADKRNKYRRSPDVNNTAHNEPRNLFSPLGSKVNLFKPVVKEKGKNIRRTNSLETLSSSYINGQWPRESTPHVSTHNALCKSTQTQWDSDSEETPIPTVDQWKPQSSSKEVFKQHLQRTKQQSSSQSQHGKQSPIQGDHTKFSQYYPAAYTQTKPVPIPVPSSPKNPLHTRRSVEGLNIELEGLDLESREDQVFARTPPDGHRPPIPGQTTPKSGVKNADTQTSKSWLDTFGSLSPNTYNKDRRSSSITSISPGFAISPAPGSKSPVKSLQPQSQQSIERESPGEEVLQQNTAKYASSPKPNNSFSFARGPPDGAEKVPLNVDEIESDANLECNSCPDTSKITFQFSSNSAFCSLQESMQKLNMKKVS